MPPSHFYSSNAFVCPSHLAHTGKIKNLIDMGKEENSTIRSFSKLFMYWAKDMSYYSMNLFMCALKKIEQWIKKWGVVNIIMFFNALGYQLESCLSYFKCFCYWDVPVVCSQKTQCHSLFIWKNAKKKKKRVISRGGILINDNIFSGAEKYSQIK